MEDDGRWKKMTEEDGRKWNMEDNGRRKKEEEGR